MRLCKDSLSNCLLSLEEKGASSIVAERQKNDALTMVKVVNDQLFDLTVVARKSEYKPCLNTRSERVSKRMHVYEDLEEQSDP